MSAPSIEEARTMAAELRGLDTVAGVQSASDLVPPIADAEIAELRAGFSAFTRDPDFAKLAESFGILGQTVTTRGQVEGAVAAARRARGALIDFRVEQEDSVYPMVPAGADLHKMIRRPSPIVETAAD